MKKAIILTIVLCYFLLPDVVFSQWTVDGLIYNSRKKITIDYTKIDENLTDFPVLVKLTSANFDFSKANADGFDIRFTSSDGTTLLKYERERQDQTNSLAEYWVKVPSVSHTVNTDFYIYYRTTDTPDGADATNVWDSNFKGVWHMQNNPANSSQILDSKLSNTVTKKADTEPNEVEAKIGKGQDFDGSNDYAEAAYSSNWEMGNGDYTIEAVVSMDIDQEEHWVLSQTSDGSVSNSGFAILANHFTPRTYICIGGSIYRPISPTALTAGTWNYIVGKRVGNTLYIFVDGVQQNYDNNIGTGTMNNPGSGIGFGEEGTIKGNYFDGKIDEARISKGIGRSDAWIAATYNSNFNTLLSYGSEEIPPVPPTITTQAVTSITISTATGNGTVTDDGRATITERGICWNTSTVPTTANNKGTSAGTTGAFTAAMTGLNAGTQYYVRAYAINSEGTSYGNEVNFTTTSFIPAIVDWNNSNVQEIILTADRSFTFTNGKSGGVYTLIIKQNPLGGRTVVWPTNIEWSNATAPVLTTSSNAVDLLKFVYDGTNYIGYAPALNVHH